LSQKFGPLGWGPGPDKEGLKNLKTALWHHPQKTQNPFFIESTRLAAYLKGLNSSLAQLLGELWLSELGQKWRLKGLSMKAKKPARCGKNSAMIIDNYK